MLNRVYISQGGNLSKAHACYEMQLERIVEYHPLCDDFGPVRLCEIGRFCAALHDALEKYPDKKIVIRIAKDNKRDLSNAVFLVGAYRMLYHDETADSVIEHFAWADTSAEPFRDASFLKPNFELTLSSCWKALERAKSLNWFCRPSSDGTWGKYHMEEYEHYDNPMNGDIHVTVPGKFVSFRGPKELAGLEYCDDPSGHREFSPEYYVEYFHAMNVRSVVRLNEPQYNTTSFTDHGIKHHDLEFEDCTPPSISITARFLQIATSEPGLIAVHCKAGLGRTGTLIALYMMHAYGFGAREAIAWLRLVRPGSVIGEQQHFLSEVEAALTNSPTSSTQSSFESEPPISRAATSGGCSSPPQDPSHLQIRRQRSMESDRVVKKERTVAESRVSKAARAASLLVRSYIFREPSPPGSSWRRTVQGLPRQPCPPRTVSSHSVLSRSNSDPDMCTTWGENGRASAAELVGLGAADPQPRFAHAPGLSLRRSNSHAGWDEVGWSEDAATSAVAAVSIQEAEPRPRDVPARKIAAEATVATVAAGPSLRRSNSDLEFREALWDCQGATSSAAAAAEPEAVAPQRKPVSFSSSSMRRSNSDLENHDDGAWRLGARSSPAPLAMPPSLASCPEGECGWVNPEVVASQVAAGMLRQAVARARAASNRAAAARSAAQCPSARSRLASVSHSFTFGKPHGGGGGLAAAALEGSAACVS